MPRKPAKSAPADTSAQDELAVALDALVDLAPPGLPEWQPLGGLACEARSTLGDGVHRRRGWDLSIENNRLVYARRVGGEEGED